MLKILKTPEGKKFLIAVACVFIVAVCVVSKAAFQGVRSEEHTSELQSHSEISYAVFCL
nr:DUF2534 family protein [Klebsiella pneumoniae]